MTKNEKKVMKIFFSLCKERKACQG